MKDEPTTHFEHSNEGNPFTRNGKVDGFFRRLDYVRTDGSSRIMLLIAVINNHAIYCLERQHVYVIQSRAGIALAEAYSPDIAELIVKRAPQEEPTK